MSRKTDLHWWHNSSIAKCNKSPAVARVSRPYSWCTLATCVHNCLSMMFRTCCCYARNVRSKCKCSYLIIYITSRSYVNKLNVRYLVEILPLQIGAKQLQLATWLLLTAYRNLPTPYPSVPSPTLYDVPFSHNTKRYRQTDDRTSYHKSDHTTQYGRLKMHKITVQIDAFGWYLVAELFNGGAATSCITVLL